MFVKKGEIFSADLHPILLSKERFLWIIVPLK
jgi:hypothetical protein